MKNAIKPSGIPKKREEATMTEDITVKVIRHNPKDPSLYITGDMLDALRVFHERVAAHSQTGRLAVSKVELWVGDRLIKYADEDGVFDVKYTKVGVYQGVEEVNE